MTKTLEATFDGEALIPDEPLDLKPNGLRVTIETSSALHRPGNVSKGGLRELFGSVDLGYPTAADNESIDADLATRIRHHSRGNPLMFVDASGLVC